MKTMVSFSFVIISSSFNGTVENPTFAWMFFQNNADISFKILNDSPPPLTGLKIEISSDWVILIPLTKDFAN